MWFYQIIQNNPKKNKNELEPSWTQHFNEGGGPNVLIRTKPKTKNKQQCVWICECLFTYFIFLICFRKNEKRKGNKIKKKETREKKKRKE